MSFVVAAVTVAAVSTAYSIDQSGKAARAQARAANEARTAAENQANLADQANNAANKKKPNVGAMLAGNQSAAGAGGAGATMLTGPAGVDLSALTLGKNTLLGQ